MDTSTTPTPRAHAPDWSKQTEELHCPLCDYNLRGLTDPRCPECGYAFEWADLTDPTRKKHPYLFEHHPNRNVWSFARTVIGQLLPRRFWRSVKPEMPSNRRRLFTYWCMTVGFIVAWLLLTTVFVAIRQPIHAHLRRTSMQQSILNATDRSQLQVEIQNFGSLQAYLDYYAPGPLNAQYWQNAWLYTRAEFRGLPYDWRFPATLLLLLWPGATLLVMQIFQVSFRQARILPIHVARVVVYCFDGPVLLLLACAAIHFARIMQIALFGYQYYGQTVLYWFEPIAVAVVILIVLYRMVSAFALYLRFKHAMATILVTQFIILLCILAPIARSEWLMNYVMNLWLRLTHPML